MSKPRKNPRCADCGERTGRPYAAYCDNCRWRHRSRRKIREWTPERDAYLRQHYDIRRKERSLEIAAHFGWPRWAINKRAKDLGLSRAKEPNWTPEQEQFLAEHVGKRTAHWMWAHLPEPRRSETAIINKLKRLGVNRLVTEGGYTLGQLELLFGIDHRAIERWAQEGKLRVQIRAYNESQNTWCVDPADVLTFIREHRDLYDLRRVDQPTFLALVFGEPYPQIETRAHRAKKAA